MSINVATQKCTQGMYIETQRHANVNTQRSRPAAPRQLMQRSVNDLQNPPHILLLCVSMLSSLVRFLSWLTFASLIIRAQLETWSSIHMLCVSMSAHHFSVEGITVLTIPLKHTATPTEFTVQQRCNVRLHHHTQISDCSSTLQFGASPPLTQLP